MRPMKIAVLVLFALAAGVASYVPLTAQTTQAAPQLCRDAAKAPYSPGAMIRHENQVYRCLNIYGDGLASSGVAWIKMDETFIPKEPTAR